MKHHPSCPTSTGLPLSLCVGCGPEACSDCGAATDLRYVRLLTAPNVWLCNDAVGCRARLSA